MSSFGVGNQTQDPKSTIPPTQREGKRETNDKAWESYGFPCSSGHGLLNKPQWPGSDNKLNHDMGYRLQLLDLD